MTKPIQEHPAVTPDSELTFGQRAADRMKDAFSTWSAIGIIAVAMGTWIATAGFGVDKFPFILLNLCLSCIAAVQCFILLIAAKRNDQISAELAHHDFDVNQEALGRISRTEEMVLQILTRMEAEGCSGTCGCAGTDGTSGATLPLSGESGEPVSQGQES